MGQLKPACGVQVVVDLSRAAAIADMRPSRLAVIGGILQARPCSAGPAVAPPLIGKIAPVTQRVSFARIRPARNTERGA